MNPPPPLRDGPQQHTIKRVSYQAPTRPSLARSHPVILERSAGGSPGKIPRKVKQAGTRALGLRDRKALRPSLTSAASPLGPLKRNKQSPASSLSGRRSSGLGAFAAPPRRVSTRITASDLIFRSPVATQESIAEATPIDTPENQLASELDSATAEVDLSGDLNEPSFQQILDEPDLPPTPTQLGLERPPGRPKGLLSSSPSSQQGTWGRRNTEGPDQTPSKLRSVDHGGSEESAQSGLALDRASFPAPTLKKRKLRGALLSELQQLKKDVAELETWSKNLGQDDLDSSSNKNNKSDNNSDPDLTKLTALLATVYPIQPAQTTYHSNDASISSLISSLLPFAVKSPPQHPPETPLINPFALQEHAQTEQYLTALAPLNLAASSPSISTSAPDLVDRHTLKFSAPPPFPSIRYKISVTYDVDPGIQSLVSLSVLSPAEGSDARIPEYLWRWIDSRLANPLLRLDVSGLCWGINRYWEALVSRAELWSHMEKQHAAVISGHSQWNNNAKPFKTSDLRHILPHIERTSMLFESKRGSVKLLLSCELIMDEWTCEPELAAGISVSVLPGSDGDSGHKVEQESKRLFQAMLEESKRNDTGSSRSDSYADVVIQATECTLGALFGVGVDVEQ
ncbi:hypothetical protein BO70DRAFT_346835 [Aspergillus heteromorphus CBS 117.55]|uniref:Uncharacterized protein n=1 Tax=Aspergillus heteromorphus CBS 117.55 TaxID=1448321 RepID=A0A317UXM9_9EURO|nr:uncharacterized protein BO70DRAFT_346835 [Aspergillus heteromorphus CBS 117.55]PWY64750.1 hypothetical protein BO70DRAFT_346835 [Aspergillus heteromorphus CBS 117.55]